MPSINLLPKDFDFDYLEEKRSKSKTASLVSLFIIITPILFFAALYFNNRAISKNIESLNSEIENVNAGIEKEIRGNKLLSVERKGEDAGFLLSEHPYFVNAVDIVQGNLASGVYLNSLDISLKENVIVSKFRGTARDYSSVVSQIAILKKASLFKNIDISSVSTNSDGYLNFGGEFEIDNKILFYNES